MLIGAVKHWYCFITLCFLGGCTASYTASVVDKSLQTLRLSEKHEIDHQQRWRLDTKTPLFIAKPGYPYTVNSGKLEYNRARLSLLSALESAFIKHYPLSTASMATFTLEQALNAASHNGSRILVYPRLIDFLQQEPLSQHSSLLGIYNTQFQILLVDVHTHKILNSSLVTSRSNYGLTKDHGALYLFEGATERYVQQLAGLFAGEP
ncbi:DUF4823 domain-containing protein [Teredinibacter purpureus]|uniref:DUF4823 domain-containing protein n=1 Tax=Teredinibacter purpureus TaxID=2731756 RepID=UPI0005F871C9|nr:DUF4823 domain-containing protein [Teredinibacter purpureus]